MTTDTPRTDAEVWKVVYHHKDEIVVDADFARQLERELAALETEFQHYRENQNTFAIALCEESEQRAEPAEAEVADLKQALEIANRSADDQMFQKREAEAEVERLKLQRDRALEIAADYCSESYLEDEMENPILQYPPTTPNP